MLLRSLPDLKSGSAEFRRWFLSKWGKENCIVLGRSRRADFGPARTRCQSGQRGAERNTVRWAGAALAWTTTSFLVLNDGRVYSTSIWHPGRWNRWRLSSAGHWPSTPPPLWRCRSRALEHDGTLAGEPPEFMENLQPHDRS